MHRLVWGKFLKNVCWLAEFASKGAVSGESGAGLVVYQLWRNDWMPIPDSERVVVAVEKVRDYLLNLDHPDGGSKAVWFHSLGYAHAEWLQLADDLLAIARKCDDFDTETTKYGVKYKATGSVGRPGYRPGTVMTVWIVEDDDPPRLVTAYPNGDK